MTSIRGWLSRVPYPHTVRVERDDGEEKTVRIGVSRSKWRDAEAAIGADAVRLEALDDAGAVIRVWEADGYEQKEKPEKPAKSKEEQMLETFARLMVDACDRATQRQSEMIASAFGMMTSLLNSIYARNAALEKAHQQWIMSAQVNNDGADADPNQGLVAAVIAQALTGGGMHMQPPQPPNGKK